MEAEKNSNESIIKVRASEECVAEREAEVLGIGIQNDTYLIGLLWVVSSECWKTAALFSLLIEVPPQHGHWRISFPWIPGIGPASEVSSVSFASRMRTDWLSAVCCWRTVDEGLWMTEEQTSCFLHPCTYFHPLFLRRVCPLWREQAYCHSLFSWILSAPVSVQCSLPGQLMCGISFTWRMFSQGLKTVGQSLSRTIVLGVLTNGLCTLPKHTPPTPPTNQKLDVGQKGHPVGR